MNYAGAWLLNVPFMHLRCGIVGVLMEAVECKRNQVTLMAVKNLLSVAGGIRGMILTMITKSLSGISRKKNENVNCF